GLDIDPTSGQVTGTPQAGTHGDHTIDITVVDERGDRASTELGFDVGPPPFAMITADGLHTCGIDILGDAFCWGYGWFGQLGNGSSANHFTPQPVSSDLEFTHITAGSDHTCGITTDGDAYCWGYGVFGQLGNGGTADHSTPQLGAGDLEFTHITAGRHHSCA